MAGLMVVCRGCRAEVDSTTVDRHLRCTSCQAMGLISADLQSYSRLWAKRTRYNRIAAPCRQTELQLVRLVQRMSRRLQERIRDAGAAGELLNAALERARQAADSQDGRILVPRTGQEILGGGARA